MSMTTSRPDGIVLSGLGMVSPIGHDAVTSCASARAGLTRIGELPGMQLVDPDSGETEPAVGHAVWLTDGFSGLGRLVRLGLAGLQDLIAYSGLREWEATGLFVNLSSGFLMTEWDRAERAALEAEGEDAEGPLPYEMARRNQVYEKWLLPTIAKLAELSIETENQFVLFGDQAGFVRIIETAIGAIQAGRFDRCIIGGIDSYVEADALDAAYALGLLKTPSMPAGFIPGEHAAFVLLEREDVARRRKGRIEATIQAPAERSESQHRFSGEPAVGAALAGAVADTLKILGDGGQHTGLLIGNLNGDPYRAYDWGCALVRLRAKFPWIDLPSWYPALPFGEIGAASGPAAICMAVRGFARGYAGTDQVLVWLSSDDGHRSAFCIRRHAG
jgi:3-oxoacyl-[acyl-carrier-protein] synthase-1